MAPPRSFCSGSGHAPRKNESTLVVMLMGAKSSSDRGNIMVDDSACEEYIARIAACWSNGGEL